MVHSLPRQEAPTPISSTVGCSRVSGDMAPGWGRGPGRLLGSLPPLAGGPALFPVPFGNAAATSGLPGAPLSCTWGWEARTAQGSSRGHPSARSHARFSSPGRTEQGLCSFIH